MVRYLDGKVWPETDEFAVRLLLSLIHHVTGVRLKAFFATAPETENGDSDGRLRCGITAMRTVLNCPLEQNTEPVTPGACELQSANLHCLTPGVHLLPLLDPAKAWRNRANVWIAAPRQAAVPRPVARALLGAVGCSALTGCMKRRPDQRALCGMFERHDGFLHCVRIRGIRCAAACPGPLSLRHADLLQMADPAAWAAISNGWRCPACWRAPQALAEQAHPQVWHAACTPLQACRRIKVASLLVTWASPINTRPLPRALQVRPSRPAAGRWAA